MSITPQSTAQDVALQLTLAAIARIDMTHFATGSLEPSTRGKRSAEFVNALYSEILAKLEAKP